uniref:Uncharacterized protein n=1 Tax=Timema cristinae TaxID=61476 RepID=A0A7R9D8Z6_TIMCR|nr:unnamed protein product [Timema cristinae]
MQLTHQTEKALTTLEKIALDNGKPMLLGRLVVDDDSSNPSRRGRIKDLLSPELCRTSLLLWFIWTVCAFCYYGVVLMTTELFESTESSCTRNQSMGLKPLESCTAECKTLTTQDYIDLLWTTLAEFPGLPNTATFCWSRYMQCNGSAGSHGDTLCCTGTDTIILGFGNRSVWSVFNSCSSGLFNASN